MENIKGLKFVSHKENIGKCITCHSLWKKGEKSRVTRVLQELEESNYLAFLKKID